MDTLDNFDDLILILQDTANMMKKTAILMRESLPLLNDDDSALMKQHASELFNASTIVDEWTFELEDFILPNNKI